MESSIHYTDEATLLAEYSQALAGNLLKINPSVAIRPQRYVLLSVNATLQKPIVKALPLVLGGTPANPLGVFISPRPYDSIVTVTDDPISGRNNREMTDVSVTLEFNPGQGWFYLYRPAVVEAWNLNPDLKTPFSTALQVRMFNYPSGTDLLSYVDGAGVLVGESAGNGGFLPSDGYQFSFASLTVFQTGPVKWVADVRGGRDYKALSPVIASVVKSSIFSLSGALSATLGSVTLSGGAMQRINGVRKIGINNLEV